MQAPGHEIRNGVRVLAACPAQGSARRASAESVLDHAAFDVQLLWFVCAEPADATVFLTTPP